MMWVFLTAIGVIGLALGMFSRRAAIDRKIEQSRGSDPELARALSEAQRDIDMGRFYGKL